MAVAKPVSTTVFFDDFTHSNPVGVEWSEYPLSPDHTKKITHFSMGEADKVTYDNKWMMSLHAHYIVTNTMTGKETGRMKGHFMKLFAFDKEELIRNAQRVLLILNDEPHINILNMT